MTSLRDLDGKPISKNRLTMNGAGWTVYCGNNYKIAAASYILYRSGIVAGANLHPLDIWAAESLLAFGPVEDGEKHEFI